MCSREENQVCLCIQVYWSQSEMFAVREVIWMGWFPCSLSPVWTLKSGFILGTKHNVTQICIWREAPLDESLGRQMGSTAGT